MSRFPSLMIGVLLVLPAGASALEAYAVRGDGLSFPSVFPDEGDALEIVGRIDPSASVSPFELDGATREYTWTLHGAVVHEVEEPAQGIRYLYLTFGVLEIREDSAINSSYAENPPNAVVPSTFHDGGVVLLGAVTNLRIREIFGIVTASGDLGFVGGESYDDLGGSVDWSFNAAVSPYGEEVPAGYSAHWTVEMTPNAPVGISSDSWGGIKSLYH